MTNQGRCIAGPPPDPIRSVIEQRDESPYSQTTSEMRCLDLSDKLLGLDRQNRRGVSTGCVVRAVRAMNFSARAKSNTSYRLEANSEILFLQKYK